MKLLSIVVLVSACGTMPVAHASISRKVKACHPNCGRVYHGYDPKKPYLIKDPFKGRKKELKVADAAPAKPATPPPPPPPPPPPVNPCLDHACAGSY